MNRVAALRRGLLRIELHTASPGSCSVYPVRLLHSTLTGANTVTARYQHDFSVAGRNLRKYISRNHRYRATAAARIAQPKIAGDTATKALYPITNSVDLDEDRPVNVFLVDSCEVTNSKVRISNTDLGRVG